MDKKIKTVLVSIAFVLFSIFVVGIGWLATTPAINAGLVLSYVAGLSMIILPCTLPLVFVIIPLALGKAPLKALTMAVLFGLGLSITISLYGAAVGFAGGYIGMNQFIRVMLTLAGVMALAFGLRELGLLNLKLPFFANILPERLQRTGDYTKSFAMGLLLGNAGVGCPNPLFYVLLTYIATVGGVGEGLWLGLIHGLGRATPLIFLAILAILGVNATNWLATKQATIKRYTGWGLIAIGAFILMIGIFGHAFWERSPIHLAWNKLVQSIGITPEITLGGHEIVILPWLLMFILIAIPIAWSVAKNKLQERYPKMANGLFILALLGVIIFGFVSQRASPLEEVHGEGKEFDITAFAWGFEPQMIRVKKGDLVTLHVTSRDINHGIASADFGFDEALVPGETVDIEFVADKSGVFQFYCSLACGAGHSDQKGFLIVEDPNEPFQEPEMIQVEKTISSPVIDASIDDIWSGSREATFPTRFLGPEKQIRVKALRDQEKIYFLIRWKDDDQNNDDTGSTDRVAVQFDISGGSEISMGAAGVPHVKEEQKTIGQGIVDIWHWKAFDSHTEQEDVIDDEFAGPFSELAKHYYRDDDDKYGGTNDLQAKGAYDSNTKEWIVEISRSLETADVAIEGFGNLDKQLIVGSEYPIAFAVWDGGEGQEGGEHQTTDWGIIRLE